MVFGVIDFLQKTNELIRFYYYATCFRSFFGGNRRPQKTISKLTDLQINLIFELTGKQFSFSLKKSVKKSDNYCRYMVRIYILIYFSQLQNRNQEHHQKLPKKRLSLGHQNLNYRKMQKFILNQSVQKPYPMAQLKRLLQRRGTFRVCQTRTLLLVVLNVKSW